MIFVGVYFVSASVVMCRLCVILSVTERPRSHENQLLAERPPIGICSCLSLSIRFERATKTTAYCRVDEYCM